jgi:intracellular septation protein
VGGVLPVISFALVEEWYGTVGGLIAGVAFGVGEIIYEYVTLKKVQTVTLAGNALVIILGGISLFESDPVMFKLQPALLLFAFAVFILGSSALKRPFLVEMSKKQMPQFNPEQNPEQWRHIQKTLGGLNTRFGFALIGLALLSTYAAYEWSTAAWAFLKGIGAPLILFIYIGIEVWLMRRRQRQRH